MGDIVDMTAVVIASDYQCTGVMTLQEALAAGLLVAEDVARYRAVVDSLVSVGDLTVLVRWTRTGDGASLSTKAVVDDTTAELIYEPMISSWRNPGPPTGTPRPPWRSTLNNTTWTWRPWDPDGATIAEMIFGKDTVWKNPVMVVTFDEKGKVVSEQEDPQVGTFIDSAKVSQKTEVLPGMRGDCKRWSFRVHWHTPTGTVKMKAGTKGFDFDVEFGGIGSSGTDLEVYELCSDGTGRVLEGPN